jgi:hypothetical protein
MKALIRKSFFRHAGMGTLPRQSRQSISNAMPAGRKKYGRIFFAVVTTAFALAGVAGARGQAPAKATKTPYPAMAPIDQYLMGRAAEIAMAQSAAPASISSHAEILVLGRHGYETAVKGENGFVCIVERSWTSDFDDPEFWDPSLRAPMCLNPTGARTRLPLTFMKTKLALDGLTKAQMFDSIRTAVEREELPKPEPGSMCYMMSREGYYGPVHGHAFPHLMFFLSHTDGAIWGANLPGSPVLAFQDTPDPVTVFAVPVRQWSDGTAAPSLVP